MSDDRIKHWTQLYAKHLSKWLFDDDFTVKKTIITYENMQSNIYGEFIKVCDFFETPFEKDKFDSILPSVNKENLKVKTKLDE